MDSCILLLPYHVRPHTWAICAQCYGSKYLPDYDELIQDDLSSLEREDIFQSDSYNPAI